jgi:CheY-like chemotaxis protein
MILVIEDNEQMIDSMQRVFSGWGWDEKVLFDSPTTAAEAIICLAAIRPEIVCLDMNFSDAYLQEGVPVAQWVQEHLPETMIVSISADSTASLRQAYAGIGCVQHFPKRKSPYEVRKCLDGKCDCQSEG